MDLGVVQDLVSTIAIVLGLLFAGVQVRQAQRDQSQDARMVLVNSFNTPDFMRLMRRVLDVPDGLTRDQIKEHFAGAEDDLYYLLGTMEGLGLLVYHRAVPIELADQAYAGPIMSSWRKLRAYCEAERVFMQREAQHEWFQWLAERLEEFEVGHDRQPAQLAYRDWTP